ncbi:MAG TPA: hypothetical protein VMT29_07165 [Steroidobacteraceae bacterium]|nr:hypothetical protein [Steroidobacteraceae bacterium]
MTTESRDTNLAPPRKRVGCLGGVLRALLFGVALFYVLCALLAPWNFYFGGHLHLIPGWQGGGWLRTTTSGGDYYLWIRLNPTTPGQRKSPLQGVAYLCTPHQERFRLKLYGSILQSHGTDLTGVPLHLYMHPRAGFFQISAHNDPVIDLYGSFGDARFVAEDRSSLARAFNPDGTLYKHDQKERHRSENVTVTFLEGSPWTISPDCPPASAPAH